MKLTKQMLREMIEESIDRQGIMDRILNPKTRPKKRAKKPTDTRSPFRDRKSAAATDKLNPMDETTMASASEEGAAAGLAAGKASKASSNDDPSHWETINAATEGREEMYRAGYIMGYSKTWGSLYGTSETPEEFGPDLGGEETWFASKDSPPVNRDFNKWKP